MKRARPEWRKISRQTGKADCIKVYELEKKKLKTLLGKVRKICLTTDLWQSKPQKIEYMVITGHFVDAKWNLQKRVLNFFQLPPPRRVIQLSNAMFECLKDWGIENKVFTISVDNATANDSCIKNLKETSSKTNRLVCGGKLFHVRCCAHILNIMVQFGLQCIQHVVEKIHDSVSYIRASEQRTELFSEIVQKLQLPHRKLIFDVKRRWNSTFDMLITAYKFKDAFSVYAKEDLSYIDFPEDSDWERVVKVCEILKSLKVPLILFLVFEVYRIKMVLDVNVNDPEDWMRAMVKNMKQKFDKYWGECNLLMDVAAILDPRYKLGGFEFVYSRMFSSLGAREHISKVKVALYELYEEYVSSHNPQNDKHNGSAAANSTRINATSSSASEDFGCHEVFNYMRSTSSNNTQKSELDMYLDEGPLIFNGNDATSFDALKWWSTNTLKFRVLSNMARDILAVPITTVASESTFSVEGRVIDTYRASLAPETVEVLLCAGDWCRALHGVKKKSKVVKEEPVEEIDLPVP